MLTSARLYLEDQQPRQMLLILRSTSLFSLAISASPLLCGPVISVPDPADLPEPVVTPLPTPAPDDRAVPAVLVPGAGGDASLEDLLFGATTAPWPLFLPERFPCQIIHSHPLDARS